MAQYKNESNGNWYIRCRSTITGRVTSIRRNPRTNMPFKTKKEAKEYEAYYLSNKIDLNMTLNQAKDLYVNDYLSLKPSPSDRSVNSWYSHNIAPVLGKRKIVGLKVRDLEMLAADMLRKNYSIKFINKQTTLINTILRFSVTHGYIDRNPVANYKPLKDVKTSEKLRYWTPAQFQTVIEAIPHRFKNTDAVLIRHVLSFAYLTGLRKSEIRAMQWKQIDRKNGIIHVDYHINNNEDRKPGRKNGDAYDVYMNTNVKLLVEEIYNRYCNMEGFSENAFVFPSIQGGFDKCLGDHTPTRWVEQLAEYTGLHNPTFHGLRHSFCSYATSVCKLSPYDVAMLLGDTVQVVLTIYHDFFNEQKIETARQMDEYGSKLSFLAKGENGESNNE